jgi:DNA recombination protein RmuC
MVLLLLGILTGCLITTLIVIVFKKQFSSKELAERIEIDLQKLFPQLLQNASQQLITMADQKLTASSQELKTDLSNKKAIIEDIVKRLHDELEKSNKRTEDADKQRISSFVQLKTELANQRKLTEQLSVTAEGLKKVLSHNQMRGHFGEQVAEDLLRMCGFVSGVDYFYNKTLKDGQSRPDFTVMLPDGVKINIDAKFPFSNLAKMTETEDSGAKLEYRKAFEQDIKEKIKQVTTRDYINPNDNTVDFVILFIPNEMIFSYIYENMQEIWTQAMSEKVIFAGPFNFTATLRLIRQSYANFTIQKGIYEIISQIRVFEEEFKKYNEEFIKIGERIESLSNQYEAVDRIRTKKLLSNVEKISRNETKALDSPDLASDSPLTDA